MKHLLAFSLLLFAVAPIFAQKTIIGLDTPSWQVTFGGLFDSDMLVPGPFVDLGTMGVGQVDAFTTNHHGAVDDPKAEFVFSVDRGTTGCVGNGLYSEASLGQQPGDLFLTRSTFPQPYPFVGLAGPAGFAGTLPTAGTGSCANRVLTQETFWGLTPLGVNKDNIDSVDFYQSHPSMRNLYFTMPAAEAGLHGYVAADIMAYPNPYAAWFPFAFANDLGLDVHGSGDSIDALIIWDRGAGNQMEAGVDMALFSLERGSATLTYLNSIGIAADASTIFFTDFSGRFAIFAWGSDLGVDTTVGNNIDAIDML